ncbi:MAG: hypothetical protein A2252_06880 [Elusimicrobia bacterium RIFOXYA2_FULL_39_19]|nr:MAG: hypothetical protein A2252_06880 [Elusimicrobia bacterium RIFOXYA2_FULL_39_19]
MTNKIIIKSILLLSLAMTAFYPSISFSAERKWQKGEIDLLGPTYYNSFGESIGKFSLIYDFNNSFTFDNQGYSQFTKRSYLYYPSYYYLSLEGSPRFYVNDWYASQNSKNLKTSMLITNHSNMWSLRRMIVFTPYTLSKVQLPGLRANIESRPLKTSLDMIYSRLNPVEESFSDNAVNTYEDIEGIVGTKQKNWSELVGGRLKIKKLNASDYTDLFEMELSPGMNYISIGDKNGSLNYSSTDTLKIVGYDLEGKIEGVNFKGEYALSEKNLLSATTSGTVMTFKADKGFFEDNVIVGGEYYKIDPQYSTTYGNPSAGSGGFNLVDDNDDSDKWVDYNTSGQQHGLYDRINPGNLYVWPAVDGNTSWGNNSTTMFNFEYDRDGDGIADWEQINLAYLADDPVLWVGEDRNNNWIVDKYEDDRLPDYTYWGNDLEGNNAYVKYKFDDLITRANIDAEGETAWLIAPIQLTVGAQSENMITVPSSSTKAGYVVLDYQKDFTSNVKFKLQYETKQVTDTYPNDLVAYSGFGGDDVLDFTNSQYDTTTLGLDFKFLKKLTVENLYVSRFNNKLDAGTTQKKAGFSSRIGYQYKFPKSLTESDPTSLLEKFTLIPKYRYVTTSSRDDLAFSGGNSNCFMFQLVYKPLDGLTFNLGKNLRYSRNTDATKDADQSLLALEMSTETSIGRNYNFVLYGGFQKKETVAPATKLKTQDEDIYFVKVYIK